MNETNDRLTSRRNFLKSAGQVAAASAFVGMVVPHVHAKEDNTIRIALVGCGGRGTGAAANALTAKGGPVKLVAMADVFDRSAQDAASGALSKEYGDQMDVPEDRKFVGFDGYKKAIDCSAPGDIAIFATPPAFRWVHFTYAIEKGINVFMEKPVTVDGPTTRRMLALAEESVKKNLKVGVGLMWRHCKARQALLDRIKAGEIGDIITLRAYRMHGPIGSFLSEPKPGGHLRFAVPDSEVPQLPLGQRRLLQRLLHSQHRRVLLDEGSLARGSPGHRRPPLSRQTTSIRTSTTTRSNTRLKMARNCFSTDGASGAVTTSSAVMSTAASGRRSSR